MFADSEAVPDSEHPIIGLKRFTEQFGPAILIAMDLTPHLSDERTKRAWRDALAACNQSGSTIVMIEHTSELPASLASMVVRYQVPLPDEEELEGVVKDTLRELNKYASLEIDLKRSEFQAMVRNLRGLTRSQAAWAVRTCVTDDWRFDREDMARMVRVKREAISQSGVLEFIDAPVELEQIGGLKRLKGWVKKRPLSIDEDAKKYGVTAPKGVMILGVQGAGKSMVSKAIASAWKVPLIRLDPAALYDRFIGESENRLRQALATASAMAPCVLWIDEIEKGFASAASTNTDGGVSRRMFGSLLTWMQERGESVFLVATANDIEALPPELIRKGRFDEVFFVDLPGEDVRRMILEIHLKKRGQKTEDIDIAALVGAMEGFSGAEIEQVVVSGLAEAYVGKKPLETETMMEVARNSPPLSVTMSEKIEHLRNWARGRCVPAD